MADASWTEGPNTLNGIMAFGCTAVSSTHGLVVGGDKVTLGHVKDVNLLDRHTGLLERVGTLEDETTGIICGRPIALLSPSGEKGVICTLGRKSSTNLMKTYLYNVNSRVFARKPNWDFPSSERGTDKPVMHALGGVLYVRTGKGVYEFKEGEASAETTSHWHKVPGGEMWDEGGSVEFNLRYASP